MHRHRGTSNATCNMSEHMCVCVCGWLGISLQRTGPVHIALSSCCSGYVEPCSNKINAGQNLHFALQLFLEIVFFCFSQVFLIIIIIHINSSPMAWFWFGCGCFAIVLNGTWYDIKGSVWYITRIINELDVVLNDSETWLSFAQNCQ